MTKSHHVEQIFLYYLINIWERNQNWLKKTLSHLSGLAHLCVFKWKIFILPKGDPGKVKWDPTYAGLLTSHMNTYFYKSFLRKVICHLGEPAHLSGPAHFHMNSPITSHWFKMFYLNCLVFTCVYCFFLKRWNYIKIFALHEYAILLSKRFSHRLTS